MISVGKLVSCKIIEGVLSIGFLQCFVCKFTMMY